MTIERPIEKPKSNDLQESAAAAERRLFSRHNETAETSPTPEARQLHSELNPAVDSTDALAAETRLRRSEAISSAPEKTTEATNDLRTTLDNYKEMGIEFDESSLDTVAAERILAQKDGATIIDLANRSDLSPAERTELLNDTMRYVEQWGGDKAWLARNNELIEEFVDLDPNVFGPEQQKALVELDQHFEGRLDTGALVSLASELDSPAESAHFLNSIAEQVDKAKQVDGMAEIVNEWARTGSSAMFRGSSFEMEWIGSNANGSDFQIKEVGLSEIRPDGKFGKSMDVRLTDGRAVELKSYAQYSGQEIIADFENQMTLDVNRRGATGAELILDNRDGQVTDSTRARLDEMVDRLRKTHAGKTFDWSTYPKS